MAQPGYPTAPPSYRIVVGIDYSEVGDTALRYALDLLPDRIDARLHVVHVAQAYGPLLSIDTADDVRTVSVDEAKAMLSDYLRDKIGATNPAIGGDRIEADVRVGSPAEEIVALAREVNADLIVVGTHGFGSVRRLILGSVADAVARHATCPVLIARPKAHEDPSIVPEPDPEPDPNPDTDGD